MAIKLSRAEEFLRFVNGSRSPFHAVLSAKNILRQVGFEEIHENVKWNVKPGGKYYYSRNQSSLVAFSIGEKFKPGNGFNLIASHTDSPCFKLKPNTNVQGQGFNQVAVSTYGGGLWHTWFDRDLTLAGRVMVSTDKGTIESLLVDIDRPILRIPTLAIHLDRSVSDGFKFNSETHLRPILETAIKSQFETTANDLHNKSLINLLAQQLKVKPEEILNFELSVADHQPAAIGGINNEFIFSARLDNLLHCFTSITSLAETASADSLKNEHNVRGILLFDHEEVGSRSAYGAMSPILNEVIERINTAFGGADQTLISKRKSLLISADMAHCIHPNYPEKHDSGHKPMMHRGPVIKINLETRYATNAESECILEYIAKKHQIPIQKFCVRNDMACGTTVGPILSADSGIRTVDIGNPQLSMHSIRETCGVSDITYCVDLCKAFLEEFASVDELLKIN